MRLLITALILYRVLSDSCYDNLDEIYDLEKQVTDDSVLREYILCPNTVFDMTEEFIDDGSDSQGHHPIILGKSNMHVKCGEDGSSANQCVLTGGAIHVALVDEFGTKRPVMNALVQGLTMQNAKWMNVWAENAGELVIKDCIFRNNSNIAPIEIAASSTSTDRTRSFRDFYKNRLTMESDVSLSVVIESCLMMDNAIWPHTEGGSHGLVAIQGAGARVSIIRTTFMSTVLESIFSGDPFIIRSIDAVITMAQNCFIGNDPRINSVVTTPGMARLASVSDFLQRASPLSTTTKCDFAALRLGAPDATCEPAGASVCYATHIPQTHCLPSLKDIVDIENTIVNTQDFRTYILCSNTEYSVTDSSVIFINRSKVRLLCGADGKSDNKCQINGGDIQLAMLDGVDSGTELGPVTDVLVQGLTFSQAESVNVVIGIPASVRFEDCIFRSNRNTATVLIRELDSDALQQMGQTRFTDGIPSKLQADGPIIGLSTNMTITSSRFEDIQIGGYASAGVITSHGANVRVVDSSFNGISTESTSSNMKYIIGAFGGRLGLADNCFEDVSAEITPVLNDGGRIVVSNNFGPSGEGRQCEFVATIKSQVAIGDDGFGQLGFSCLQFNGRKCGLHDEPSRPKKSSSPGLALVAAILLSVGGFILHNL